MKAAWALGVVLGLALAPSVARADEPATAPPSGTAFLAVGGVLAGLGVANAATAPLCKLAIVRESAQTACVVTSIAFAGAFVAAGVPLLVIGAKRRARIGAAPTVGGGMVVVGGSF